MALSQAMEPSLKRCSLAWNKKFRQLNEVFRYQSVISSYLVLDPQGISDNLTFDFKSERDPLTNKPIHIEVTKLDFTELTGESAIDLLKFAAFKMIQRTNYVAKKIELSVRYQILCDETSMIGVIKQENKSTEQPKEVKFSFKDYVPEIKKGPDPMQEMNRANEASHIQRVE